MIKINFLESSREKVKTNKPITFEKSLDLL